MKIIAIKPWDYDKHLSKSFTVGDLVADPKAFEFRILEQYIERAEILTNLEFLCSSLLQPLQDGTPWPIKVISGYRCNFLNKVRGGRANSLHLIGYAADITCYGHLPYIAELIQQMEFHIVKAYPGYIHVSKREIWNECRFEKYR